MSKNLPKLSLVLGGAASGKSALAEKLAISEGITKTYIATAQAFDDEMKSKIERHKIMRGTNWTTLEAPLNLAHAVSGAPTNSVILIDCLTLWLSNHLLADTLSDDLGTDLLNAIKTRETPVICVSNETGLGVVPDNALARKFRQAQGELNQHIAQHADLVVNVTAGLPHILKGSMPPGLR